MIGIDRYTGKTISGTEQLKSRIREIFTTRIGTLPKRRDLGTDLLDMLGTDLSNTNVAQTQHHLLERLNDPVNGLTDIHIDQVQIQTQDSIALITVRGRFKINQEPFSITL